LIIQWYPGHMAKAKRLIQANLPAVDMVVEILDARLPLSSRNPDLAQIIEKKTRVLALNKNDLADPILVEKWVKHFQKEGLTAVPIDALNGQGLNKLANAIRASVAEKMAKIKEKRGKARPIRLMVLGIPNVGKSSLINKLAKQTSAKVGNKPGVTKGKQWIKIAHDMELLDTPGVLWPKFEDQEVGKKLAATGAINDDVFPVEEVIYWLVAYLRQEKPDLLKARYKLDSLPETIEEILEAIGRKRGCLAAGGVLNVTKVYALLLQEFRKGLLGKVTLDKPEGAE